jgi:hypothetical protein
MQRTTGYVPFWAVKFLIGVVVLLFAVALFAALVGTAVRGPAEFFDQLGKTIARVAPQPQADIRDEEQLKRVISAMPDGKLRVGSVIAEQDRVVFTVTADRSAVKAAVQPGDELRISRGGEVEIVPTGIPGVIDRLQRAIEDLRRQFFGGP